MRVRSWGVAREGPSLRRVRPAPRDAQVRLRPLAHVLPYLVVPPGARERQLLRCRGSVDRDRGRAAVVARVKKGNPCRKERMKLARILLPIFFVISLAVPTHSQHDCFGWISPPLDPQRVLLVIVDDVGNDMLADAAGHTPSIDALRDEGLWFDRFWAAPSCSPFRAKVFSGRYGFRGESLVGRVIQEKHGEVWSLPVATALPAAVDGDSYLAGKWHLAQPSRHAHPLECGFDSGWYTLFNLAPSGGSYYGGPCFEDGQPSSWTGYVTVETASRAADAILRKDQFVVASFHAPHKPYEEPPAWMHTYGDLTGADDYELALAMFEAADTMIGRISDLALERGYTVFVVSDNGTSGNHGGPKGSLSEGSVCTWMVAAGPGVREGETTSRLVDATDLYATITDLTNGCPSAAPDSFTFRDELYAPGGAGRPFLFVDKFKPNGAAPSSQDHLRALRDARWKAVWPEGGQNDHPGEFYDLDADPGESNNLLLGPMTVEQAEALDALLGMHPQ